MRSLHLATSLILALLSTEAAADPRAPTTTAESCRKVLKQLERVPGTTLTAKLQNCKGIDGLTPEEQAQLAEALGEPLTDTDEDTSTQSNPKDSLVNARSHTLYALEKKGLRPGRQYRANSSTVINKSGNGGAGLASTVPDEVLTLFSVLTDVAIKKTKRSGLTYLQKEMQAHVCGFKAHKPSGSLSLSVDRKPEDLGIQLLPETCALLQGTPLERIASEPELLASAISHDLISVVAKEILQSVTPVAAATPAASAMKLVNLAIGITARTFETKHYTLGASDVQLIVATLLDDHVNGSAFWNDRVTAVAIGGLALAVEIASANKPLDAATLAAIDIPAILTALCPDEDRTLACTPTERADAAILTALGVTALSATTSAGKADVHARATASIQLVFGISDRVLKEPLKRYAQGLKTVLLASLDRDTPRALVAGSKLLEEIIDVKCVGGCMESTKELLVKITTLLSSIASYASTYVRQGENEPLPSADELQARRAAALEAAIDAFTDREHRHSKWVISLGLPVGFAVGMQSHRVTTPKAGFVKPELMPPQLSLPLGVAFQRIPSKKKIGFHSMVTVLDLAQFVAYDASGELTKPSWNTFMSPGAQIGLLFGSPTNSFVLAGDVRYAPSLFKDGDQPGGALRVGLFLAYYIPLFDF